MSLRGEAEVIYDASKGLVVDCHVLRARNDVAYDNKKGCSKETFKQPLMIGAVPALRHRKRRCEGPGNTDQTSILLIFCLI